MSGRWATPPPRSHLEDLLCSRALKSGVACILAGHCICLVSFWVSPAFSQLASLRHIAVFYWVGNLIPDLFLENSGQVVMESSLSSLVPNPTDAVCSIQCKEISLWILKRRLTCSWGQASPHFPSEIIVHWISLFGFIFLWSSIKACRWWGEGFRPTIWVII